MENYISCSSEKSTNSKTADINFHDHINYINQQYRFHIEFMKLNSNLDIIQEKNDFLSKQRTINIQTKKVFSKQQFRFHMGFITMRSKKLITRIWC